jgi:anti-sigma-K factor RskA
MTPFWKTPGNLAVVVIVAVVAGVVGYALGLSASQQTQPATAETWTDAHGWTP